MYVRTQLRPYLLHCMPAATKPTSTSHYVLPDLRNDTPVTEDVACAVDVCRKLKLRQVTNNITFLQMILTLLILILWVQRRLHLALR